MVLYSPPSLSSGVSWVLAVFKFPSLCSCFLILRLPVFQPGVLHHVCSHHGTGSLVSVIKWILTSVPRTNCRYW